MGGGTGTGMARSLRRTKTARVINAEESVRYYFSLEGMLRKGDVVTTHNKRREFVMQARGAKVITLHGMDDFIEKNFYTLGIDDEGRYMEFAKTQSVFSDSKEYTKLSQLLWSIVGGYNRR